MSIPIINDENLHVHTAGISTKKKFQKTHKTGDITNPNTFANYKTGIKSPSTPQNSHNKTKNKNFGKLFTQKTSSALTKEFTDTISGSLLTTLSAKCNVQYVNPNGQKTNLQAKWLTFQNNGKMVIYASPNHNPLDSTIDVLERQVTSQYLLNMMEYGMIEQLNPNLLCEPEAVVDFGLLAKSKILGYGSAIQIKKVLLDTTQSVNHTSLRCCQVTRKDLKQVL